MFDPRTPRVVTTKDYRANMREWNASLATEGPILIGTASDPVALVMAPPPARSPQSCTGCSHYRTSGAWTCPDEGTAWADTWDDSGVGTEPPPGTPPCPARDPVAPTKLPPSIVALLSVLDGETPLDAVRERMRAECGYAPASVPEVVRRAARMGVVTVTRPNRTRSETWTVRRG